MTFADLPAANAALNAATTCLLLAGWGMIRAKRVRAHRACMMAAFGLSMVFLVGYLTHKFTVGPKAFPGQGPVRGAYFAILISHTLLAIVNLPLVVTALVLAVHGREAAHRRVARWAFPVWMYVSVTGVAVYWMLYRVAWD